MELHAQTARPRHDHKKQRSGSTTAQQGKRVKQCAQATLRSLPAWEPEPEPGARSQASARAHDAHSHSPAAVEHHGLALDAQRLRRELGRCQANANGKRRDESTSREVNATMDAW